MHGRTPVRFFRRVDVKETIDLLGGSRCRRLVIVVGAGSSAESGLPLWEELVRRLLIRAVEITGLAKPGEGHALAGELLDRERNLLSAATMARVALANAFEDELRLALYEHPDDDRTGAPGPLARAVARTVRAFHEAGLFIEVITTNYDDYLEQALRAEGLSRVRSLVTNTDPDPSDVVVRHAHGMLLADGTRKGQVVLAEADYHTTATVESWQERYFHDRLKDSFVLYVGASLTDLNMLRVLFRYPHRKGRVHAVLVRTADVALQPDVPEPTHPTASSHEALALDRWRSLGVNVLFADHYSQQGQFLFEVAQRKRDGADYVPYGQRLDTWFRAVAGRTLGLRSAADFALAQQLQNTILREALEVLIPVTALEPEPGEYLSLHVWVRSPNRLRIGRLSSGRLNMDSLAMLICSDRRWTDPQAAETRLMMLPTRRASVEAFSHGVPRIHQQVTTANQWNFVLAVPVVLDGADGRLPVGAISINSNFPGPTSCLARLQAADWEGFLRLTQLLQELGEAFLNPPAA